MSLDVASEHVCYVHCNFCNTILAVSVPSTSLYNVVTVRCGHCANLLSVNMGALLQPLPLQDIQNHNSSSEDSTKGSGSSSKCNKVSMLDTAENEQPRMLPMRLDLDQLKLAHVSYTMNLAAPEKRQRVPSAYNRFIKEEIQRIKASNPEISHREAFSTAAKNWAHFPHIHFGLTLDGNKHVKLDEAIVGEGPKKTQGFY